MLRLAHRGDWRQARENSITALATALAVPGCDGVEFDVRIASDGVPVLVHDEALDRTYGCPGLVEAMTAGELEETAGIATLADALAMIPHRAAINVDLKGPHDRVVVEVLAAGRGPDFANSVVSSFMPDTLERIGRLAPSWPRWLNSYHLTDATIETAAELGCQAVSVEFHAIDPASFAAARSAGLDVAAWTVRRRSTYGRLQRLGVVAACVEAAALDG
ncbi:MAG TPA: glycerophosphodiester phosphodiesterase [Candidatus Limnocylindrales bacterium]|nr:glycerophosphodiester phosphodiesterase [Candidatus Limnocylindrales bacterium]